MKTKILLGLGALLLVVFVWVFANRGMHVEVANVGPAELEDVVVTVTGIEHDLGDVDAGDTATSRLESKGEAGLVEVTWTVNGRECYARVGCYFEASGYNGVVRFEIDGMVAKSAEADVDIGFF